MDLAWWHSASAPCRRLPQPLTRSNLQEGCGCRPPLGMTSQETWWTGLHLEWDNCPEVRARIRGGANLLLPHPILNSVDGSIDRSVHNCRFNKLVMIPALRRWAEHGPEYSPGIDHIFDEIMKFYKLALRTDVTMSDVHRDAWALRKLMGLVKAQPTKQSVPREPQQYYTADVLHLQTFMPELGIHCLGPRLCRAPSSLRLRSCSGRARGAA